MTATEHVNRCSTIEQIINSKLLHTLNGCFEAMENADIISTSCSHYLRTFNGCQHEDESAKSYAGNTAK